MLTLTVFLMSCALGRSSGLYVQQPMSIVQRRSACSFPWGTCTSGRVGIFPPTTVNMIAKSLTPSNGIDLVTTSYINISTLSLSLVNQETYVTYIYNLAMYCINCRLFHASAIYQLTIPSAYMSLACVGFVSPLITSGAWSSSNFKSIRYI